MFEIVVLTVAAAAIAGAWGLLRESLAEEAKRAPQPVRQREPFPPL
ncbi:MAG TPA: hypothetical protein VM328_10440 [Fimbriimonadaceae bacterium]|nr:hypothetical protein [Fimbriimonadaceae bacterium]